MRVLLVSTVPAVMRTGEVRYRMDWPIRQFLLAGFHVVITLRVSRSAIEIPRCHVCKPHTYTTSGVNDEIFKRTKRAREGTTHWHTNASQSSVDNSHGSSFPSCASVEHPRIHSFALTSIPRRFVGTGAVEPEELQTLTRHKRYERRQRAISGRTGGRCASDWTERAEPRVGGTVGAREYAAIERESGLNTARFDQSKRLGCAFVKRGCRG